MIVFDLKCARPGHVFESWFASTAAFEDQRARGLIACPFCSSTKVEKAVMAPNVGSKGNQVAASPVAAAKPAEPSAEDVKTFLTTMAKAQSEMLKSSQWVGSDFDANARAMDAGEIDKVSIHGEATPQQAKALIEDGIGVLPLPFPVVPPRKRN
jgi:hypothetical protein